MEFELAMMMNMMILKVSLNKTYLIPFICISSSSRSLFTIRHLVITPQSKIFKGTYLTKPLSIFTAIRFSGKAQPMKEVAKKSNLPVMGHSPKPLPPSIKELPKVTSTKDSSNKPSEKAGSAPLPGKPKLHQDIAYGVKPLADKYQNKSLLAKVEQHIQDNPFPMSPSQTVVPGFPSNTTSKSTADNTPLTPTTGALVLYKSKESVPIKNSAPTSTIYVNSDGIAFLDHTNIPIPPILPPCQPKSLPNKITPTISNSSLPITEKALEKAKANLKPQIPTDTLIPDVSNDEPPLVAEKASYFGKKLPKETVIKEMFGRGLFIKDNSLPIEVMTETGEKLIIGKTCDKKLTGSGYAYYKKVNKPLYIEQNFDYSNKEFPFYIVAVKYNANCFHPFAEYLHLSVVCKISDLFWLSPGYLTSRPTGVQLGAMQFKLYQDITYAAKILPDKSKPQFFALYDNAKKISPDQMIFLKGGQDYLQYLGQIEGLTKLCQDQMQKPFVNYTMEGLTPEQCIKACMDYDTVIRKKLPHPSTYTDISNSAKMATKKKPVTDDETSE
jgi:hypothetical protein